MDIQILGKQEDLSRTEWVFYIDDRLEIKVDSYTEQERPSKRHKWRRAGVYYNRLRFKRWDKQSLKAPPEIPLSVRAELISKITDSLTFKEPKQWT